MIQMELVGFPDVRELGQFPFYTAVRDSKAASRVAVLEWDEEESRDAMGFKGRCASGGN